MFDRGLRYWVVEEAEVVSYIYLIDADKRVENLPLEARINPFYAWDNVPFPTKYPSSRYSNSHSAHRFALSTTGRSLRKKEMRYGVMYFCGDEVSSGSKFNLTPSNGAAGRTRSDSVTLARGLGEANARKLSRMVMMMSHLGKSRPNLSTVNSPSSFGLDAVFEAVTLKSSSPSRTLLLLWKGKLDSDLCCRMVLELRDVMPPPDKGDDDGAIRFATRIDATQCPINRSSTLTA